MARIVSLWRCKCGTWVKVVAEADSSPSTQIALCPKCRAPHAIHADKINSVMEDIEDRSEPRRVDACCDEKERLLVAQNKAFEIYLRGTSELAKAVGAMAHAEFEFLAKKVRVARHSLREIRQQLNEHTAKHGC